MRIFFWLITFGVTTYAGWKMLPDPLHDRLTVTVSKAIVPQAEKIIGHTLGGSTEQERIALVEKIDQKLTAIKANAAVVADKKSPPEQVASSSAALAHDVQAAVALTQELQKTTGSSPTGRIVEHALNALLPIASCPAK